MLRRFAIAASVLVFAFAILFTSALRTAAVKYDFAPMTKVAGEAQVLGEETANIDYYLAFPGRVLPDHPIWPLKALRDKVWLWITTNPSRSAELKLLFADKRVSMSKALFDKGKPEVGFSTLTKAEKYLEEASNQEKENREAGIDTGDFLQRIALASLKHFQVMEEIKAIAPEDAQPGIIQTQNYTKKAYEDARNALQGAGASVPENPFDWN
ncbi:MAG: DUF5667 domain-containing protein [Patescibacteria group bacterium]